MPIDGEQLFRSHVALCGGPTPLRRFLPDMKVFYLTLPLDQVAGGHRAMDERRAVKALLRP